MTTHDCPLCGLDFEGAACHGACPLSNGCAMVRCPRCGYEFVESGPITRLARRVAGAFALSISTVLRRTPKET